MIIRVPRYLKYLDDLQKIGLNSKKLFIYSLELFLDVKFIRYVTGQISYASRTYKEISLGGWLHLYYASMIYSIVRLKKPEIIVETGVGPGGSSASILNAIKRNAKGTLYSIDLPNYDNIAYPKNGKIFNNVYLPPGYNVGWLVPPWLKDRWRLIIGDTKEELPKLVSSISSIDIFLHDSLHVDEHIYFELNTVLPFMQENGVLLADDVNDNWSLAFVKWCKYNQFLFAVMGNRLGISVLQNNTIGDKCVG